MDSQVPAHTMLVRKFEASEEASQKARQESERCRDYYDGRQLTPEQIAALNKRKQPVVIENLIRPKIDYLCGLERQSRTDPRAWPRTAAHDDDANACTDALRYVTDDQDFPIKRSHVFQNILIEGYGGVEAGHSQTRDGIDPAITLLDWDRIFYDPHSCRADFSDATYMGFITWMDLSQAKLRWKDKEKILTDTANQGTSTLFETYDDKPRWATWFDATRDRVRVVTMYHLRDGIWHRCVFTLSGELEESAPSPYLDEDGKPNNAIILQSAYVDRDNDRYGIVRDFLTLQDEVNKRRSKFLHLSNSRQMRVSPNVGVDPETVRREMTRPDGVFVGEHGEVEVIGTGDMAAGHFNLLAEAKDAIKSVGPNATLQGKSSTEKSGRAILALQQGGMTEMAPILDALRHFNIRVYRALWCRIRQFWTAERWVRVTDDEKNVRFVGLNTTRGNIAAAKLQDALKAGQIDQQTAQAYAMQLQADPSMMEPANVIAEIDVDIEIDEQVDTPTLQIEQFEQLATLAPMMPQQLLPAFAEMMIEASQLRNKDKLREIIEQMKQPQQDPMQEQMGQIAIADAASKIEETQSKTAKNYAAAEASQVKAMTDAISAGYDTGLAA